MEGHEQGTVSDNSQKEAEVKLATGQNHHDNEASHSKENSDTELVPFVPPMTVKEDYNGVSKYSETVEKEANKESDQLPLSSEIIDENNNADAERPTPSHVLSETPSLPFSFLKDLSLSYESGSSCCWWKSRSMHGKCQVQPLIKKLKNKYGPKKKKNEDELFKTVKVVKGLCSMCIQDSEDHCECCCHKEPEPEDEKECDPPNGKPKPLLVTESEYRSSYQWPGENCSRKSPGTKTLNEHLQHLGRMHKLYNRPPWNYSTFMPPPTTYESLRNTETKLNALDSALKASKLDNIYVNVS
ncbi:hypothetical protein Ocin01_10847 [Orchesella cincta]|uniref:Uncharacterized protein n=1 Tax=Orchesella cincta TaxID=48709 RepID=A0A1D2MRZ1_ORCCI|nr:hypothetical protein Ocin01_10847 [Orchesella cincta]